MVEVGVAGLVGAALLLVGAGGVTWYADRCSSLRHKGNVWEAVDARVAHVAAHPAAPLHSNVFLWSWVVLVMDALAMLLPPAPDPLTLRVGTAVMCGLLGFGAAQVWYAFIAWNRWLHTLRQQCAAAWLDEARRADGDDDDDDGGGGEDEMVPLLAPLLSTDPPAVQQLVRRLVRDLTARGATVEVIDLGRRPRGGEVRADEETDS